MRFDEMQQKRYAIRAVFGSGLHCFHASFCSHSKCALSVMLCARQATVLMALLQPAPEVYELFDDIMLLSEGHIVFHGPKEEVGLSRSVLLVEHVTWQ